MWRLIHSAVSALRFRDYKPQPLTSTSVKRWIMQFEKRDRKLANKLLREVIYLSESTTRDILLNQNAALQERLKTAGLSTKQMIYVQVHDAGSSSPVMLNLLRDGAHLERLGCKMVDSRDSLNLKRIMNELGEGAIIYVDDFIGTGNQFCEARDFAAQNFVGSFSEFVIAPSICEEGLYQLAERGIEAFTGHVHSKAERPLHANSNVFKPDEKKRLSLMCEGINRKFGLGYKNLATMVILYRNSPNTVPSVLRGNLNQKPFAGLFPRTTDLPI